MADSPKEDAGSLSPCVTVVATRTVDRWPRDNGVEEYPGGPAHYITLALQRLGCRYRLITGSMVEVEVIPSDEGENYLIPAIPTIVLPPYVEGDALILSPIIGEINARAIPRVAGLVAVDIQGFVRTPSCPTDTSLHDIDIANLLRRADIVKSSEREILMLNPASRSALADVILLVTRGAEGASIYHRQHEHRIPARYVKASNTVGAGDTYLAAYVHALLQGRSIVDAGHSAARFTETFLIERAERGELKASS